MIRLDIDEARLGALFPAFMQIDSDGTIVAAGPALRRHMPDIACPARLTDHFLIERDIDPGQLGDLARDGGLLQLAARKSQVRLSGSVLVLAGGYLLAMRYLPSQFSLGADNLQMSDFGPDDPVVPGLMLVGLQKALLEESRLTAAELARERQRSVDLLQRTSQTAGFMAHDFNNFLSIIRLNADRIGPGDAGRNRRLAGIISETAERASEITRSLMTLSRQRFESRLPLQPDSLILENLAFFRTLVGSRVRLEVDLGASGRLVETSRVALLNSILNILINARDAMPDGGTVRIATAIRQACLSPDGCDGDAGLRDYLAIVISDSGAGMPPEVLTRAFEPLFSTKPHGNGIGLASVLDFAREMGGEACIDSLPELGTSLHIYLPLAGEMAIAVQSKAPPSGEAAPSARPRILLVEDEPYALEALTEMLEEQGFEVTGCGGVPEARAALDTGRFRLLLTDIVLAEESGLDLAAEACDRNPGIGIIVMSGYVPEGAAVRAGWHFIRKPLDGQVLNDMIASLLGTPAGSDRHLEQSGRGRPAS